MFYPSAYVGTMILTGLREWRPVGGVPTIRIAEDGHPRELVGWGTVRPSWLKAPEDLPQMHKPDWLSWPKR
jgi:hypothetical protein